MREGRFFCAFPAFPRRLRIRFWCPWFFRNHLSQILLIRRETKDKKRDKKDIKKKLALKVFVRGAHPSFFGETYFHPISRPSFWTLFSF
jgi:hypothetical protein